MRLGTAQNEKGPRAPNMRLQVMAQVLRETEDEEENIAPLEKNCETAGAL